jgi:hypothetical protein
MFAEDSLKTLKTVTPPRHDRSMEFEALDHAIELLEEEE